MDIVGPLPRSQAGNRYILVVCDYGTRYPEWSDLIKRSKACSRRRHLIPFLLFAYREVPQESSGYSLFKLLYGRDMRGPLDILKESWRGGKRSDTNVISMMRERIERMATEVHENMDKARSRQKTWYDKVAREKSFHPGDQVLVLLPTSSSKLTAQRQGPYDVIKQIGKVNYQLKMHDCRNKTAVFHVNMLQKWHTPKAMGFFIRDVSEDQEDIPFGMMAKVEQPRWALSSVCHRSRNYTVY